MQHGLASLFAQSLLQSVMKGYLLTPFDIKALMDLIFTPMHTRVTLCYDS